MIVGGAGWEVCTEIKLCILNIGKEAETMAMADLTKREPKNGEEKGSKQRTLGHTVVNWSRGGEGVSHGDKSLLERYD